MSQNTTITSSGFKAKMPQSGSLLLDTSIIFSAALLLDTSNYKSLCKRREKIKKDHFDALHSESKRLSTEMRSRELDEISRLYFLKMKDLNDPDVYDFACLLQLLEAIVLHDEIFLITLKDSLVDLRELKGFHRVDGMMKVLPGGESFTSTLQKQRFENLSRMDDSSDKMSERIKRRSRYMGKPDPEDFERERYFAEKMDHFKKTEQSQTFGDVFDPLTISVASKYGIAYQPPPVDRKRWWSKSVGRSDYSSFAEKTFSQIEKQVEKGMSERKGFSASTRFKLEIPLIAYYVIKQKGYRNNDIVGTALKVRESKEATAFRKVCTEYDSATRVGDSKSMVQLENEIINASNRLNYKYQPKTTELAIQVPLAISMSLAPFLEKLRHSRKHHLIFIDNLYTASLGQEGLRREFFKHL